MRGRTRNMARSRLSITPTFGTLERGTHRWPSALVRSALRAVLNVQTDADIGLFIIHADGLAPAGVVDGGGTNPVGPPTQPLTPDASPRHHLGAELRRWREARGRSISELAQTVHVSADLIRKVERAERTAHSDLISRCDDVLSTGGALGSLLTLIEHIERLSATEPSPAAAEVVIQVVVELLPRRRRAEQEAPSPDTGARIYQFPIGGG